MINPFPYIPLFLNRQPRQRVVYGVDFEWSRKSFVHNVFRVYELIFWRRKGVREEASSWSDGTRMYYKVYTWEALFAHIEVFIRSLFRLPAFGRVKVYYPLEIHNGALVKSPYLFAIAFDAASTGTVSGSGDLNFTHVCTGSNLTLTGGAFALSGSSTTIASGDYNSVSMTLGVQAAIAANHRASAIYYLAAPATGSHTLHLASSVGTSNMSGGGISLTGTNASPAGNTGDSGESTTITPSVTVSTAADNSVIVDLMWVNESVLTSNAVATGTGQTKRYSVDNPSGLGQFGSTMTTTTAGSYSPAWLVVSSLASDIAMEIKAAASTGPANVKTFDGVTQSTGIKTYFGAVTVANTKTLDGVN